MRHAPILILGLVFGAVLGLARTSTAQSGIVVGSVPPPPRVIEDPTNTAVGLGALASNTTGTSNTASGAEALAANTAGSANTASGYQALFSNTEGQANTASGSSALYHNLTGGANSAYGDSAMYFNTEGNSNVAVGNAALYSNLTGNSNTAVGAQALTAATGFENTAVGASAGLNATTGSYNLFLGSQVWGEATDTNTIRIGLPADTLGAGTGQNRTFIAGIYGTQLTSAHLVVIDANGQLGTKPMPPPLQTGSGILPPALVALQQELQQQRSANDDQRALIADLRARLARLEQLVNAGARRK